MLFEIKSKSDVTPIAVIVRTVKLTTNTVLSELSILAVRAALQVLSGTPLFTLENTK